MRMIIPLCAAAIAFVAVSMVPERAEARSTTYYGRHGHKSGSVRHSRSGGSVYNRHGHKVGSFRRH